MEFPEILHSFCQENTESPFLVIGWVRVPIPEDLEPGHSQILDSAWLHHLDILVMTHLLDVILAHINTIPL